MVLMEMTMTVWAVNHTNSNRVFRVIVVALLLLIIGLLASDRFERTSQTIFDLQYEKA